MNLLNYDRTKPEPIEEYTRQDCEECLKHYTVIERQMASKLNKSGQVSRDGQLNRLQRLVARRDLLHFEAVAVDMFLGLVDNSLG